MTPATERLELPDLRLNSRAEGAMLAAATGDALGWPIEPAGSRVGGTRELEPRLEFCSWLRREGGGWAPYEREIPAGTYSDDTQLTLAVARSRSLGDDWWRYLATVELPVWTLYELGGGGAVKQAAQSWAKGTPPWQGTKKVRERYLEAGANGVAMRVLPHAIYHARDSNFDAAAEAIFADGVTTHGHPRALVGALAAGYAMWVALRWQGKLPYGGLVDICLKERREWSRLPNIESIVPGWLEEVGTDAGSRFEKRWELTIEEMVGLLITTTEAMGRGSLARDSQVLDELGMFGDEGGAGTRTAAAALYLASRYVTRPSAGLVAAAFARKSDADTIASITGALLGSFSGDEWIAEIGSQVQDAVYIRRVARAVADHAPARMQLNGEWDSGVKRAFFNELSTRKEGDTIPLPIFGGGRVEQIARPATRSQNEITIWWMETEIGQKLAITRVKKLSDQEKATKNSTLDNEKSDPEHTEVEASPPEKQSGASRADKTPPVAWMIFLVHDIERSLRLYHEHLGMSLLRRGTGTATLEPNIVLKQQASTEPRFRPYRQSSSIKSYEGSELFVVRVRPERFKRLHQVLMADGFDTSRIVADPNGDRFRLVDEDGRIVEVREFTT